MKTENTPNELTADKLEIYSPIDNDFYEVDSFEDAEKFIKENYIEDGDIHPDIESIVIFQKVGFVHVEDLENGNCKVSVVQEPKLIKPQQANELTAEQLELGNKLPLYIIHGHRMFMEEDVLKLYSKLKKAKEKEILGDRKIVQLDHDKVVLKAELQQANNEIEELKKIISQQSKRHNELYDKLQIEVIVKNNMLEKTAGVIGNVEIYFEQENFNDDYDGVLRDSEETILNNCKELLTKYKQ